MINRNPIVVYDLETGSTNPNKTQIVEIAAVALNPRTLEIIPDSEFYSLVNIMDEEEAHAKGYDEVQDKALEVNGKTREQLADAPGIKTVWTQFCGYLSNLKYKNDQWSNPIPAGYNILGFDNIILDRVASNFGPYDNDRLKAKIWHPIYAIDLMQALMFWFENTKEPSRMSLDAFRKYFGMSDEGAHAADTDVKQTAEIVVRFLKLHRAMFPRINFQKAG